MLNYNYNCTHTVLIVCLGQLNGYANASPSSRLCDLNLDSAFLSFDGCFHVCAAHLNYLWSGDTSLCCAASRRVLPRERWELHIRLDGEDVEQRYSAANANAARLQSNHVYNCAK